MMDLRWRVLIFLAVLLADAAIFTSGLLALSIGVAAYLLLVYPVIFRER